MRNKQLFLALLALFISLPLMAYDFKVDGVAYNILSAEERTVEVTAGENSAFYSGDVVIPPSVTYDGITYMVTKIGREAFYGSPMTSISLPTTIKVIDHYCFYYCRQLKSLTIPEGVETIGGFTISDCSNLQSVSFPSTMIEIDNSNFTYCTNLRTITVAPGNPKYDSRDNCNAIIETKTNTLYEGCCGTTIPNTVTTIGEYSLSYTSMDSLYIPESITEIEYNNYFNVTKIYTKDLKTWCNIVFAWETINFEELYIDGKLLEGDIVIPNTAKRPGYFKNYQKINSVHISSSVELIPPTTFYNCKNLKTVTFDDGTTKIGECAFTNCYNLQKIILPNSVKIIENNAFENCTNLKSFRFPANIQTFGSNIFANCPKLALLVIDAKYPPRINDDTFSEEIYNNVPLYVPKGMKSLYEMAVNWKKFQTIIDDEEPNENLNMYFEADNLYYHVTSVKDMVVEVTSYQDYIGKYIQDDDYDEIKDKETTEVVIPATVTDKDNGLTFTVTKVAGSTYVHKQFVNAESIRIPKTIKEIDQWALSKTIDVKIEDLSLWCKIDFVGNRILESPNNYNIYMNSMLDRNLYLNDQLVTDLVFPDGVTSVSDAAFLGFKSIKSVTFAPSVKYIGTMAFDHTSLEKVVIPSTLERIGTRAFAGCFDLKDLTIENGVQEIGAAAFGDCLDLPKVVIPTSVKKINNFAFRCCKSLNEVTFADGIEEIGEWCFALCENLESVAIPSSVKTIGRHAFNGCKSLNNVQLREGLENIDRYAFTNCTALESLNIPASVQYVGRNLVEDCTNLKTLTVASGNTTYDTRNNGNILFETATNAIVALTPEAEIPEGVDSIGDYAFAYLCDRQSIDIPEGVRILGNYAFLHCWSLHTITIPESVTSIGYRTFDSCEGFESVVAMSAEPCQMNDEAFTPGTYRRATLYVPDDAIERYRNADGWKKFAHIESHTDWQLGIEPIVDNNVTTPVFKVENRRILLSNLSANERINVYRIDGILVKTVKAAPDGRAIIVLPENGTYVIHTQTAVKKVTL